LLSRLGPLVLLLLDFDVIWLFNLLTVSVPDEGYSISVYALNQIPTFLLKSLYLKQIVI